MRPLFAIVLVALALAAATGPASSAPLPALPRTELAGAGAEPVNYYRRHCCRYGYYRPHALFGFYPAYSFYIGPRYRYRHW